MMTETHANSCVRSSASRVGRWIRPEPISSNGYGRKEKFDLVVSDMNLESDQSGLDLLKDLRSHCPVILVTGSARSTLRGSCPRRCLGFYFQPFKVEEVVAIARRALEQAEKSTAEDRKQNTLRSL